MCGDAGADASERKSVCSGTPACTECGSKNSNSDASLWSSLPHGERASAGELGADEVDDDDGDDDEDALRSKS